VGCAGEHPNGDPFKYQYLLSLNGVGSDDQFGNTGGIKGDTIEVWSNNQGTAQDIDFSPLFNDPAETALYIQKYDFLVGGTNTGPLARIVTAAGSSFGADAVLLRGDRIPDLGPLEQRRDHNVSQLASLRYFLATSANANNYNKDSECQFVPNTTLAITKSVTPTSVPVNGTTPIDYTITVTNTGTSNATGVTIDDPALPAYVTGIAVAVSSSSMSVSWTVVTTNRSR
jgi:uncharacterized repeat protein (TIGR01451 family)